MGAILDPSLWLSVPTATMLAYKPQREESIMGRRILIVVVLAVGLALVPAGLAQAKAPLRGETDHWPGTCFEGPYLQAWEGTISVGDFDGWIEWWIDVETWTAWDELTDPAQPPLPNASHYTMKVLIYDDEPETCADSNPVLATLEHGTTTLANTTWRANGVVTEANGFFSGWDGRRVHESGEFIMGPTGPVSGVSIFRIN
jgi:hypothetical protein